MHAFDDVRFVGRASAAAAQESLHGIAAAVAAPAFLQSAAVEAFAAAHALAFAEAARLARLAPPGGTNAEREVGFEDGVRACAAEIRRLAEGRPAAATNAAPHSALASVEDRFRLPASVRSPLMQALAAIRHDVLTQCLRACESMPPPISTPAHRGGFEEGCLACADAIGRALTP